ncbi:unnamed protein product [Phytophthora lilii]|uniref:Unnamed protein product n=1 Tax=Phytophthora lilii TaxID=2077276 RepID=A0A9W7DAA5_9STRA|nr:unnamed protein product [Phytophthora lilii]
MFSSWDLVRPRFWYPMSSLEQSMMELEHMSDLMTRSHFPFDMRNEMLAAPSTLDDDDFFRDLPVLAREQTPATQHRRAEDQPMETPAQPKPTPKPAKTTTTTTARDNDPNKRSSSSTNAAKNQKNSKLVEANAGADADADNQYRRAFSSYSFSNSSIVDDKGRRVTSTRRRYEDSTGRLKAVHERQIEGKKLRTTWNRTSPDDEGQHEAVCTSGTPEEFEALWQQTPFGEAQKKTIKQQQEKQQQLEQGQQGVQQPASKAKAEAELEPTPMEE